MALQKQVTELLDNLINEGESLLKDTQFSGSMRRETINNEEKLHDWSNKLLLFTSITSKLIEPWKERLQHNGYETGAAPIRLALSALETIRSAAKKNLLTRYEDIIFAEAFADLYEQGQHLFSQGYYLAAGVLFRAVLEEHLRHLCERNECIPTKEKPTINDFNMALYKHDPPVYDKGVMQHVTALATVGNDAAHNEPELKQDDVKRLQDGLLGFLGRFKG